MPKICVGSLVRWNPHDLLGSVLKIEGRAVWVDFDDGRTLSFAIDSGSLERVPFTPGDQVQFVAGAQVGVILQVIPDQDRPAWKVSFPGRTVTLLESSLRPAVLDDPMERMKAGLLGTATDFNVKSVAADLWTAHRFNELVSLSHARVDLKPHQVAVVHRVASNYPHRFLLCDEVGLGKTIEAAMIVKELRARKQAARVLILVPSGLTRQWQFELKTKFNETFAIYNRATLEFLKNIRGAANPWTDTESIITSHSWASWSPERRKAIVDVEWDLIIVDEAHHARKQRYGNREQRTNLYRLIYDLTARPEFSRRAALFLTATPMQLQRHELYSLVEMLDPILFASEADFVEHIQELSGLSSIVERLERDGKPDDPGELDQVIQMVATYSEVSDDEATRIVDESSGDQIATLLRTHHRLSQIMIRNRRRVVGGFQPRTAFRWEVHLSEAEKRVQELMDEILTEGFRVADATRQNSLGFLMTTFQKLAASSSRALSTSLRKRRERLLSGATRSLKQLSEKDVEDALDDDQLAAEIASQFAVDTQFEVDRFDEVIALVDKIEIDSKARVLVERLSELFDAEASAKVIIFTEFRETQDMLSDVLSQSGWQVHKFHGQLDALQKDRAVETFREGSGSQILLSTEAGGEGRNFQFCHYLVNYDLPWNPMKVEQRIGRIDRIGQEHPVVIFNFHVLGTIESRILDVLEFRIKMFTEAVGGLEPILGETEADIRKALRLSAEARDRELERLAVLTERNVLQAREAERHMADFVLDAKSFSAEIAKAAMQADSPVTQEEFERFMIAILSRANTWIGESNSKGERKIMFHAPFTLERPDLIDGREKRRVCFDPRSNVDSEHVEYLGFGHPIIDALTERAISEDYSGAAAVRRLECEAGAGWSFNWIVRVGGLRTRAHMLPIFVDDEDVASREIAESLLRRSRLFAAEESAAKIEIGNLDSAHKVASQEVGRFAGDLQSAAAEEAREKIDVETSRVEALFDHRTQAARDRITSCEMTLKKLKASSDEGSRAVVPLWEANVDRARLELDAIRNDRERMLQELSRRRTPTCEYELLSVARIVPDESTGESR